MEVMLFKITQMFRISAELGARLFVEKRSGIYGSLKVVAYDDTLARCGKVR